MNDTMRALVEGTPAADGPIRFVAGTEGMKSDGRDYRMSGMDLGRFEANPVVMWVHDLTQPPIGRGVPQVDGDRLILDVEFDLDDEFAAKIDGKYRRGFLNAVSMTAIPTDGRGNYSSRRGVIEHSELVEVSACPVPVDPDSLVSRAVRDSMRNLGRDLIDLGSLRSLTVNDQRERLRSTLNERFGGESVWVWVRDFNADEMWVVYEVETDGECACYRLGYTVDADDNLTLDDGDPVEVEVRTSYEPVNAPDPSSQDTTSDQPTEDPAVRALTGLAEAMGFVRSTPHTNDLDAELSAFAAAVTRS